MKYRNAKYIDETRIECEIEHPLHGWIPYGLDPTDLDKTVDNAELLLAMKQAGDVIPYTPPTPEELKAQAKAVLESERAVMTLSFSQLMIGLVSEGWITEAEGDKWLVGELPPTVLSIIQMLPQTSRFMAKARAVRPTEVYRTDPLLNMLGEAQGKSPEQLDDFFRTYRNI
jgi:hypothetical protein